MRIVVQTLMFDNSFIQMDIVHNTISVLAFFKFCCLFTGLCFLKLSYGSNKIIQSPIVTENRSMGTDLEDTYAVHNQHDV